MTRHALLVLAASTVLAGASCSPGESPRATPSPEAAGAATPPLAAPAPIAVFVTLPEDPGPGVEDWARELRGAIAAGHGGLSIAESPDAALVVVRIDAVGTEAGVRPEPPGEGEIVVARGAIVLGETSRGFSLAYRGEARPQAEALARNLRRFAAERAADAPAVPARVGTDTPPGEPE